MDLLIARTKKGYRMLESVISVVNRTRPTGYPPPFEDRPIGKDGILLSPRDDEIRNLFSEA